MRPITGIISGTPSELNFDPAKAHLPVNVWFRHDGTIWFGVAEMSAFIPTRHEDGVRLFGFCELVGDCWRWEGEGDPFGFELTDTDYGDYFERVAQRAAFKDLKEQLAKAFAPLVDLWAFILKKFGAKK